MSTLHEILSRKASGAYYASLVPAFVKANLQIKFPLRQYQQEAVGRFVYQYEQGENKENQWLLQMATGSGKTIVMAALIIYLYKKGFRNFLFFVNSANIIEKTKDNFLNEASSKYLFADDLNIDGQEVRIKAVNNFQSANEDDLNMVFTTIQALHSKLTTPKENNISYQDFEDKPTVLISDEAHHINVDTKRGKQARQSDEQQSWETTANRIFNANKENILLEFTATTDFSHSAISDKYEGKIIYDYSLRQFRKDGFSKDIAIFEAGASPFQRALTAILLSQYRLKLFKKYGLNIKPVVLFKSKTIKESLAFQQAFEEQLGLLSEPQLARILTHSAEKPLLAFSHFLKKEKQSLAHLIAELQQDFSEKKLLSVNSKDETEAKQLAVNSLEDAANPYRAIFAVDKLNEGWDVLNLFDIVRLYDTKDASAKTTMAEAQLIGRGARYCPFIIDENDEPYKRKFDHHPEHELGICERLYYHSAHNPNYIAELGKALVATGIRAAKGEKNERLKPELTILHKEAKSVLKALVRQHNTIAKQTGNKQQSALPNLPKSIVRKAFNKYPFYRFARLKKLFPELTSVSEFIESGEYLGNTVIASNEHSIEEILQSVSSFLSNIAARLSD